MTFITNEQLCFCIQQRCPELVAGRDYLVARHLSASDEQTGHAFIFEWKSSAPMPHIEVLYEDWLALAPAYADAIEAAAVRAKRDRLLAETDTAISIALGQSDDDKVIALRAYQQQLRDVPAQSGFPSNVSWPMLDTAPPDRATAMVRAWDRIKLERDRRKASGVLVGGQWFHSDADSRIQWLGIKDTARDMLAASQASTDPVLVLGQPLQWKTLSGAFVTVTAQMAFDVVEATKELDARLFAVAEAKRATMESAEDPAAYDALAGWPATYEG